MKPYFSPSIYEKKEDLQSKVNDCGCWCGRIQNWCKYCNVNGHCIRTACYFKAGEQHG